MTFLPVGNCQSSWSYLSFGNDSLPKSECEIKFLFHSQLEMDLTHAITFTRKIQGLFHITGVVQHRQAQDTADKVGLKHKHLQIFHLFCKFSSVFPLLQYKGEKSFLNSKSALKKSKKSIIIS